MLSLARPHLLSHLRALLAVARRDWLIFWRYPLNAVSEAFQPLIWLAPVFFLGQIFSVNGQARAFAGFAGTTDFMSFILLGAVLSRYIDTVFWTMGYSLKNDMDSGVLESNWLTPVPRPLLLIGHTLTNLLTTTVTTALMLAAGALLFGFHASGNTGAALLTALPMLIGLYGFGFAFAALVLILREANTLVDVSSFLVQMLSGAQFPVSALPRWLLPLALALPLTYGLDAVRGWLLGSRTILPIPWEIALLALFMFVMIGLGLAAFAALERRVRQRGTLGQH